VIALPASPGKLGGNLSASLYGAPHRHSYTLKPELKLKTLLQSDIPPFWRGCSTEHLTMARYTTDKNLGRLLGVVVAVVVVGTLYFARVVLIPFTLAVLITFVLTPVAKLLERMHFGRLFSTLIVVVLSFITVGAVGWTVTQQFGQVMNQLPDYRSNIREKLESLHLSKGSALNNASDTMNEISKDLAAPPARPDGSSSSSSRSATPSRQRPMPVEIVKSPSLPLESVESILGLLATFCIVVVLTFFMLVRRENLRNRLISLAGQRSLYVMTQAIDDATARVTRYLRLQLLVNICYGAFIGTCLHFIGVPGALLWGVMVGLLRFLPYIGPPLGGILPLLLSIAIFDGWVKPLETLGLFVVTEVLVSNFLEPMLYGAYTGISSMAILLAAIFWTAIWGPIGLVLCTPLTVCVVVIGRHVPSLGFLTVLLGSEPTLTSDTRYYQRLLAGDREEAKHVLESYLETKPLEDLYDSVLLPALSLSERDRHRDRLDKSSAEFIASNTRRIVEELFAEPKNDLPPEDGSNTHAQTLAAPAQAPHRAPSSNSTTPKIVCLPARDEADEIVATMLCQLLSRAGFAAECIPLGRTSEMVLRAAQSAPNIVCISALPPYALSHAKSAYAQLRAHLPETDILLGIWNYQGDLDRLVARVGIAHDHTLVITLAQAVSEISARDSSRSVSASVPRSAPPEPVPAQAGPRN
jgi:predicted PurR-regulated permease PerM/methylmalonyl-CoA mutase cobalamin-binding subunit